MDTITVDTVRHPDGVTFGQVLVPDEKIMIEAEGYRVSALGLQVTKADLTWNEYCAMGEQLQFLEGGIRWYIGDWINYGEFRWGDKYTQAIKATGNKLQTLMNWAWVARRVPYHRRRLGLTFTHHEIVARLEPEEQTRWLDMAVQGDWNTRELEEAIRQAERAALLGRSQINALPEPQISGQPEVLPEREVAGSNGHISTLRDSTNGRQAAEAVAEGASPYAASDGAQISGHREIYREPVRQNAQEELLQILYAVADLLGLPYEQNNEANLQRAFDLVERAVKLLGGTL